MEKRLDTTIVRQMLNRVDGVCIEPRKLFETRLGEVIHRVMWFYIGDVVPCLVEALAGKSPRMREAAAHALTQMLEHAVDNRTVVPALTDALQDDNR